MTSMTNSENFIETILFSDLPAFRIGDRSPVKIMGVINLSPESFYAESFIPKDKLLKQIQNFINEGATFIDLGARSTAPWSDTISIETELERIEYALSMLPGMIPDNVIVSIDTQYSKVARSALQFGKINNIHMVLNDISCFQTDPELINVVTEFNCPVILMATFSKPGDAKTPSDIILAFQKVLLKLDQKGYDISKVIIDPGIGKWIKEKTYEFDLAMLDRLKEFRRFKLPILVGLSRKSFIGTVLNEKEPLKRDIGSISATAIAVYNGAHIIRTHDVDRKMRQTITMAEAIRSKHSLDKLPDVVNMTEDYIRLHYQKEFQ